MATVVKYPGRVDEDVIKLVETIEDAYERAEAHKTAWRYRERERREARANG
jgi:hypothetical protein